MTVINPLIIRGKILIAFCHSSASANNSIYVFKTFLFGLGLGLGRDKGRRISAEPTKA
jgi:hypothetical protein